MISVTTVIEDKTGECMVLTLFNQVEPDLTFCQLQKVFPKGIEIGLKNPYIMVSISGMIVLRNDNP